MKWKNLGLVFKADRYAQTPTPLVLDDRVRVYFAERDGRNKSFIRFVDLDLEDPSKLLSLASPPCLDNGALGGFDSCGQMPSYALRHKGANTEIIALWYSGWLAPAGDVPYHNATGCVSSMDGGATFQRMRAGPVLDRTRDEPYIAVTPMFVGSSCWYISGLRWESLGGAYEPIYGIAMASLATGRWKRDRALVIPQLHPRECFSRPWVTKIGDVWHMHYCYRSAVDYRDGPNAYRLGYANSADGLKWTRLDDQVEIEPQDWCSTMMCYPALFMAGGKRYMLFNGNTFGKGGFGLAVAE